MALYSCSSRRPGVLGEVMMRGKFLCKSSTFPVIRDCRLLWGMLALQLPAGGGESFARKGFLGTFLCREVLTQAGNVRKILCNTSLCPLKSQHFISWSSANTVPVILPLPLSPADPGSLQVKHSQPSGSFSKSQEAWEVFVQSLLTQTRPDVGQVGKIESHKPR